MAKKVPAVIVADAGVKGLRIQLCAVCWHARSHWDDSQKAVEVDHLTFTSKALYTWYNQS